MSWAAARRGQYIFGIFLVFSIPIGIAAFFLWYTPPTCFDGKINQGEVAIDRGGPCELLADSQTADATVLFARPFEVVPGVWSALAHVDNPNFEAAAYKVPYAFKLVDEDGILVAERQGTMTITPNGVTPVFEGGIRSGERRVAQAFFELLEDPVWLARKSAANHVTVRERELLTDGTVRLTATIENLTLNDITKLVVVVSLFDLEDNALAASKTVIERLPARGKEQVIFTWPRPFPREVGRFEIQPIVIPEKR